MKEIIEKIKDYLPFCISERRMSHTLAVAEEAKKLAEMYGIDGEKMYIAGLLHDITKEKKLPEQLELCISFCEPWTDDDIKSPKIFHSVTGALVAKDKFPEAVDDEILSAISCHTTGKPDMGLADKLLYLADYIEPTRTFPDCVELRNMFYSAEKFDISHLNKIILTSFNMTLRMLIEDGEPIHPKTVAARNSILDKIERESEK